MSNSQEPQLKISPKMIVIGAVLLVVYLLIKPTLEERFGWDLPELVDGPQIGQNEPAEDSRPDSKPKQTNEVIKPTIRPVPDDSHPVADQSVAQTQEMPPAVVSNKSANSNSASTESKTSSIEKSTASSKKPSSTKPELGQLKELSGKVYLSTAGLKYGPGSIDNHRLMHVMQHATDNLDKPVHGVFNVEKKEILILLDEAWEMAQKRGPPQVKKENQGERTTYTIDMGKTVGYVGGQVGKRKNRPKCRKIKLVLEDDYVITAYPTQF